MPTIKSDANKVLLQQLKDPFDPSLVKWRSGGGGKQLAFIDARDVMKRLDTVLGAENYQTNQTPIDGGSICELSLFLKVADGSYQWVTRSDGANNTKIEPIKGGISGALKRAANAWGVGRYLYYLKPGQVYPSTGRFDPANLSTWPKWSLPGNNIENWEDIAEMEADADTGMDEIESTELIIEKINEIRQATSWEEYQLILDAMDANEQLKYASEMQKKTNELVEKNAQPTV